MPDSGVDENTALFQSKLETDNCIVRMILRLLFNLSLAAIPAIAVAIYTVNSLYTRRFQPCLFSAPGSQEFFSRQYGPWNEKPASEITQNIIRRKNKIFTNEENNLK